MFIIRFTEKCDPAQPNFSCEISKYFSKAALKPALHYLINLIDLSNSTDLTL